MLFFKLAPGIYFQKKFSLVEKSALLALGERVFCCKKEVPKTEL